MIYEEKCFEIVIKKETLRGIVHKGGNANVLIYCPGLAGDRVDCHRIPVDFGRFAAENGWDLIRFDHRGIGVSDGNTILYGFNDALIDIEAVIDYACTTYNKIALVGISQAAIQTYYLANKNEFVDILLLWSPLFDKNNSVIKEENNVITSTNFPYAGRVWNTENEELYKGKNLAKAGDVIRISRKFQREKQTRLFGYPNTGMWISSRYYEERRKILAQCTKNRDIEIALFAGELDESVAKDSVVKSLSRNIGMNIIKDGDHLFSDVSCRYKLFQMSIKWLNSRLN